MGIHAEDVLVCVWRFLRFFINTTYVCVQKHPFVSCTLFIGFLVYVFFNVLLYHLPFLVFVAVLLRIFWSSERQHDDKLEKDEKLQRAEPVERQTNNNVPSYQRQKSRRTQFSKDRAFGASLEGNDAKLGVVREKKLKPSYVSEEDDEEIRSNNKAVEWNEDDQKNLDDLGISEIERNRRLESLIAKRKARKKEKLCSTISCPSPALPPAPRKVSTTAPPPATTATNPFEEDDEGLQAPGSAPPVLFPGKNPFDIPYDQTEEKPDLTADGFQEEFLAAEKDSFTYCRHESFRYGGFDDRFESERERRDAKLSAFFGTHDKSGFTRPSDNERLIEQLLGTSTKSQVESRAQYPTQTLESETSKMTERSLNDKENSNNNMDTVSISETTSSSSFDVSNKSVEAMTASVDPHYDTSPTSNDKTRGGMFFGHTPTYSIASDLQVEVSEIGSPPLTVGNVSPNDGDSLSFDDEMELHAQLSFDVESLDDINQALEKVGKLRDASSSATSVREATTTMLPLADQLSSHPFFESVYGTTEEITPIPHEETAEENTIDDTGNDFIDDSEHQEKHDDEDEVVNTTMTVPPQNTDEHQSLESEDTISDNPHEEEEEEEEEESINEVSKLVEENQNSGAGTEGGESLVEEVAVNPSSPSSPGSTPSAQILADSVFSSSLNQRMQIINGVIEQANNGPSSVAQRPSQSGDLETLQEKSESEKIDEPATEDKAGC